MTVPSLGRIAGSAFAPLELAAGPGMSTARATQLAWAEDADPAADEDRAAAVETCHRRTGQRWVHGADRTCA
ncbi:hypothetical protein ACIA8E_30175 [Streptomyces sp. NPDC051664]|uniref:hypothetical protein n=1 Tax=Streptomyces sp. NPDC051664 TaxID=3365668 RepID=UPI0037A20E78